MATKRKTYTKLQCEVCKRINYFSHKSKDTVEKKEKKLKLNKFCKWCRKHTPHVESKR